VLLLLRYGADPFVPQLAVDSKMFAPDILDLAKAKREETAKNSKAPWSLEKALKNSKVSDPKPPSAWNRFRSRYSSGKRERHDLDL